MRKRAIWVLMLFALMGMGAGGWYWFGEGTRKVMYRTTPVERGEIQSTISATGTLNAVA